MLTTMVHPDAALPSKHLMHRALVFMQRYLQRLLTLVHPGKDGVGN